MKSSNLLLSSVAAALALSVSMARSAGRMSALAATPAVLLLLCNERIAGAFRLYQACSVLDCLQNLHLPSSIHLRARLAAVKVSGLV